MEAILVIIAALLIHQQSTGSGLCNPETCMEQEETAMVCDMDKHEQMLTQLYQSLGDTNTPTDVVPQCDGEPVH